MTALPSVETPSVWRLALQPSVVRRALRIAAVVGTVLIAINHGDRVVNGTVDARAVLKMMLTVVVPYVVSTLSSVGAMRDLAKAGERGGAGTLVNRVNHGLRRDGGRG